MASITLTPNRGEPGSTVTVEGTGFASSSDLFALFNGIPVTLSVATTDGSGDFTATFTVPRFPAGPDISYTLQITDGSDNTATATFDMCGTNNGDGWDSGVNPILASGGYNVDIPVDGTPTPLEGKVLAYAHHDGGHYVAWVDPSATSDVDDPFGANNDNLTIFPPAANHSINVTMTPDDGGAVVTFELDTNYTYIFGHGFAGDGIDGFQCQCHADIHTHIGDPVWIKKFWFNLWWKPIYGARFASDGTTLWLAVLTQETVPYPWISGDDAVSCDETDSDTGSPCNSYSQASQFTPLSVLESEYRTVPAVISGVDYEQDLVNAATGNNISFHPAVGVPDDFRYDVLTPISDGGEAGSGHWSPPCVVMFAGGQGGFSRIGQMSAKFCPGIDEAEGIANGGLLNTPNFSQTTPMGSFFSGISLAASEAEPGVCHLVWSEGGDNGGRGGWDNGALSRDYRVGYTAWDAGGMTLETDLFNSHIDRSEFFFPYGGNSTGYAWPTQEDMKATGMHSVRNDHGSPVLFIAWPRVVTNPDQTEPDSFGNPWLDRGLVLGLPAVEMYDISGGSATLLQTLGPDLIPTEDETAFYYGDGSHGSGPYAPDSLYGGTAGYGDHITGFGNGKSAVVTDRAFAVSRLYEDPLAGGDPVYLLSVPWAQAPATISNASAVDIPASFMMRGFYRVPVDGSAAFDFMDGIRQLDFTVISCNDLFYIQTGQSVGASVLTSGLGFQFGSDDFYSDPHNVWMPEYRLQYDRVCDNRWAQFRDGGDGSYVLPPIWDTETPSHGNDYDTENDTISYVAFPADWPVSLFDYAVVKICRECIPCKCQPIGMHVWQKV